MCLLLLITVCFDGLYKSVAKRKKTHVSNYYHSTVSFDKITSDLNGTLAYRGEKLIVTGKYSIFHDLSSFKPFAVNDFNLAKNIKYAFWDRKHYGKRRKIWLPAFSPFPTMF